MQEIKFEKCDRIYLPTTNPGKLIEVELAYHKGGMNVFTYQTEKRGYYVHVTSMEVIDRGGYKMYAYTAFSGRKLCVHECGRKSAKAERDAAAEVNECIDVIKDMIAFVAKKNNLEVLEND